MDNDIGNQSLQWFFWASTLSRQDNHLLGNKGTHYIKKYCVVVVSKGMHSLLVLVILQLKASVQKWDWCQSLFVAARWMDKSTADLIGCRCWVCRDRSVKLSFFATKFKRYVSDNCSFWFDKGLALKHNLRAQLKFSRDTCLHWLCVLQRVLNASKSTPKACLCSRCLHYVDNCPCLDASSKIGSYGLHDAKRIMTAHVHDAFYLNTGFCVLRLLFCLRLPLLGLIIKLQISTDCEPAGLLSHNQGPKLGIMVRLHHGREHTPKCRLTPHCLHALSVLQLTEDNNSAKTTAQSYKSRLHSQKTPALHVHSQQSVDPHMLVGNLQNTLHLHIPS